MGEKVTKVSAFSVLDVMGERNMDIRGFSLFDNLTNVSAHKGYGKITMTIDPKTAGDIMTNKPLIAILIVADKDQFNKIHDELLKLNEPG